MKVVPLSLVPYDLKFGHYPPKDIINLSIYITLEEIADFILWIARSSRVVHTSDEVCRFYLGSIVKDYNVYLITNNDTIRILQ